MDSRRSAGAPALRKSGMASFISISIFLSLFGLCDLVTAQSVPYARSYNKPKADVQQALKDLQAYSGQKLPVLDGFVAAVDQPLDRYERGFYQFSIELLPGDSGATLARVSAKITAWLADQDLAKSGYRVLPSNGRLELDLLDRVEKELNGKKDSAPVTARPDVQAPRPRLDLSGVPGAPTAHPAPEIARTPDEVTALRIKREQQEKRVQQLNAEIENLQEIKRTQAHPQNLVTVRSSGTPVYARGMESSRVLFQAAVKDEFEFLDFEGEWIHVSISGDSRGYLRRGAVELPEYLATKMAAHSSSLEEKYPAFRIEREENGTFPGSWEPLKGKAVKIYTVQIVSQNPKETGGAIRQKYTLALFQKGANEGSPESAASLGVAVIFDSADGGIAGATTEYIQRISSGAIKEDAFWAQSYLDPPDAFQPTKAK
jgi:hypothetical protein